MHRYICHFFTHWEQNFFLCNAAFAGGMAIGGYWEGLGVFGISILPHWIPSHSRAVWRLAAIGKVWEDLGGFGRNGDIYCRLEESAFAGGMVSIFR